MSLLDVVAAGLPEWTSRVRTMRRAVDQRHYKPAMLLAALDLLDDGLSPVGPLPTRPLARRFREILTGAQLPGAEAARMPAWHLALDSGTPHPYWRFEPPLARQPSAAGLERPGVAVRLLPEIAAELRDEDDRVVARHVLYELLERDGRDECVRLLDAWPGDLRDLRLAEQAMEQRLEQPFHLEDPDAAVMTSTRSSFVRDRALRNVVLPLYEHRCALCGDRIRWNGLVGVEAAHVKPHSRRGVADPRNALALCRTHHWAFDQYLWTATQDGRVQVQRPRRGRPDDVAALARFDRLAVLPAAETARPHRLALEWHGERFREAAGA